MRLSDHADKMASRGVDGADLSGPVLDSKGFLIKRPEPPPPEEAKEVVLRASPRALSLMARLVDDFMTANPTFDNEVTAADGELEAARRTILNQLLEQGITPIEDDPPRDVFGEDLVEPVAARFVGMLRAGLGPDKFAEMCRRNREEAEPGTCHSHDFLDANEVMLAAIGTLGGCTDVGSPAHQYLHNAAWEAARARLRSE